MNKRTFLKTLGVGSVAAVAAPLSLFAQPAKVADDFKLMEFSFIPAPVKFKGYDWRPTYISFDAVIADIVRRDKDPIYAIIIEYVNTKEYNNHHAWQVEAIICEEKDAIHVPSRQQWNGALMFDSFFHTPERELLKKDRFYVSFIPITPGPWYGEKH